MPSRSVDLEKEWKRAKKPAAGYPVRRPAKDLIVEYVDQQAKREKKRPATR